MFQTLLGPIFSGLALSWTIYQFWTKKAQDKAFEEKQAIHAAIRMSQAYAEKEINELKIELKSQKEEFEKMKLSVVTLLNQSRNQDTTFQRIEKVLDRHETKLDTFGKVIVK